MGNLMNLTEKRRATRLFPKPETDFKIELIQTSGSFFVAHGKLLNISQNGMSFAVPNSKLLLSPGERLMFVFRRNGEEILTGMLILIHSHSDEKGTVGYGASLIFSSLSFMDGYLKILDELDR